MAFIDEFYPPEEKAEWETIIWPRLVELHAKTAVLQLPDEAPCEVRVGEQYSEWELVVVLTEPEPLAVMERHFARWGLVAYVGANGPAAIVRKAIGRLDVLSRIEKSFPPDYPDRLLAAGEDVLAEQVMSCEKEPSYEAVAGLLPPLHSYTFLGTPSSQEKIIVMPDGCLGHFPEWGGRKDLAQVIFDPCEAIPIPEHDSSGLATKQATFPP